MQEISKKTKNGMLLTAFMFVAVIVKTIAATGIDSDTWFILNNGRYIFQNGIPHENPFSIHNNMPIVISQPVTSLLEYLVFKVLGNFGLFVWVLLFVCLSVYAIYKLCMNVESSLTKLSTKFVASTVAFLVSSLFLCPFWSNRPQLLTISLLAFELLILEKYKNSNGKCKHLMLMPLISLLIANIHGSFYIAIYLPIFAYFGAYLLVFISKKIPFFNKISEHVRSLPAIELIGTTVCMIIAGLFNPYGIEGNLYLFTSYKKASQFNLIQELQSPQLFCLPTFFFLLELITGCVWISKLWKTDKLNLYHILLWIGGNLAYLFAIRNMLISAVFSIPLLAHMFLNSMVSEKICETFCKLCSKNCWQKTMLLISLAAVSTGIVSYQNAWRVKDCHTTPVDAICYLNQHVENKENAKIYTSFNNGAYVEWNGYKTYIDARPELYEQNDKKIYSEFVTIYRSTADPEIFLNKYDFDYLIINDGSSSAEALLRYYLDNNDAWIKVVEGNKYEMYYKK